MSAFEVAIAILLGIIAVVFVGVVVVYCVKSAKGKNVKTSNVDAHKKDVDNGAENAVKDSCANEVVLNENVETSQTTEIVSTEVEQTVTKIENNEPTIETVPDIVEEDTEVYLGREEETGFAIIARFKKSFMARIIQSSNETKEYYSELKNAILSYKKTTSRISWQYDSINSGRTKVLKFAMRGKTLCVYFALNAEEFENTKYNVKAVTAKKYADVPCMLKVSGPRKKKHALELIEIVAEKLGLEKGEKKNENYVVPFETTEELIKKGLIKELISKENYDEYTARRIAAAAKAEDAVTAKTDDENDDDEIDVETIPDVVEEDTEVYLGREKETGFAIIARFNKSFIARIIQSSNETKEYYSELKNAVLSYKKTTSRISWQYDSINSGRTKVLKFAMRGKTLCVYFALNAEEFENTKYNVKAVTAKKYADVPCMLKVSGPRKKKHALELIEIVAEKLGLEKGEIQSRDYVMPFETTEELIKKGLIKELISKEDYDLYVRRKNLVVINQKQKETVTAEEVDEILADEVAASVVVEEHHNEKLRGKKCVINIDTLSRCYNANELVNLKTLKEKGLLPSNAGYVKVLARGSLNKPLTVEVNDYSIEAVKMILLTGGTVLKY